DADRGLDQLLASLPSNAVVPPRLKLETREINLGTLQIGESRSLTLHLENQGMRVLYGTVACADANSNWLSLGDKGETSRSFQFSHDMTLPFKVTPDRLRAGNKPLEAKLVVESNGGTATVTVRATVPVKPYPSGVLAGAKSPRQVAEKAKLNPKE